MKNRSLWEGPTLDKFVENCLPCWRKQHEEEGKAETKHYDLTTTIPHPFVQLRAVKAKVKESRMKLNLRRRGVRGKWV